MIIYQVTKWDPYFAECPDTLDLKSNMLWESNPLFSTIEKAKIYIAKDADEEVVWNGATDIELSDGTEYSIKEMEID